MSEMTVRAANVTKSYGRTVAAHAVSFEIGRGITGFLGPNGAGKTTLLRILATVLPPTAGTVEICGLSLASPEQRVAIRRRLGYLPQDPGFHPNFTAREFVDYVAVLKEITGARERRDEVDRVLDAVSLRKVAGRKIRTLSGGMRRRVGLAQALLGAPDVLILDEPTAGLDPEQRLRFRELVSRLAEDRIVLLSTHQTEDIAALCRGVVVLGRAEVRFQGTAAELADVAKEHVWLADASDPQAQLSWRTADGRYRNIGNAPPGAQLVAPTIDDGYLLLAGREALSDADEDAA